ncbi:MAG: Crp/Fnr family transcriptional regulator [Sandaracinaceae bacterium]
MSDREALVRRVVGEHVELSASEVRTLADGLSPVRRRANAPVLGGSDTSATYLLFGQGVVRTYTIDASGRERNLRFLAGPNLAVALSSVIRGTATQERLASLTAVEGYIGDLGRLKRHRRYLECMRALAEQHYLALERRVHMLQQPFAGERYRVFRESMDPAIVRDVPDHHVASYLGVTPETLSRAKRRIRE